MPEQFVSINGALVPRDQACVPLYDHGLLYGDGMFEGIRVYGNRVFQLDAHVVRLFFSARVLNIHLPMTQGEMRETILNTVRANKHDNGYVRVTVTRGTGLGLDPRAVTTGPNVYISCEQLALYPPDLYEKGLNIVTVATRLPSPDVIDPRVKCTGKYVNNILAKMEANLAGAGEGLMLTREGYVGEATGDNIFIIKSGELLTPPTYLGILDGITRNAVMTLARGANIVVREPVLTLSDVYTADELFLTGTAAEVIPAVVCDGRTIGDGTPGPITRQLVGLFREYAHTAGVPVNE